MGTECNMAKNLYQNLLLDILIYLWNEQIFSHIDNSWGVRMGGNMKTEIINIRVVSFWPRAVGLRSFFHPKIRVSYHKCCRIMAKISVEASNWRFCTEPKKWKKNVKYFTILGVLNSTDFWANRNRDISGQIDLTIFDWICQ